MLTAWLRLGRSFATLLWLLTAAHQAMASDQVIGGTAGDPLQITVSDSATVDILRFNSLDSSYDNQYFSPTDYNTFLVTASSSTSAVYSGSADLNNVTPVSNAIAGNNVTTSLTAGDNISIVHTLTYVPNSSNVEHNWVITNNGTTSYTSMSLRYGGDTHFLNDDSALGFFDASSGLLYSVNPSLTGIMGLYADPTTPSTNFYEDFYASVTSALENGASPLGNTVNSTYVDNGSALEWVFSGNQLVAFNNHSPISFTAWEIFDTPTQVSVTPPAATVLQGSVPTTLTFDIGNLEAQSDTFNLLIQASPGVTVQSWATVSPPVSNPRNVTLVPNAHTQLNVVVVGSPALASSSNLCGVSVVARSQSVNTIIGQGDTAVTGASTVSVIAPIENHYIAGQSSTATFTVVNLESITDTFDYSAQADPGITITGVTHVNQVLSSLSRVRRLHQLQLVADTGDSLNSNQSANVTVTFVADPSLTGTSAHLTLTGTSETDSSITGTGTAICDITAANTQVQVISPPAQIGTPNSVVPITFNVYNLESVADTFVITGTGSNGYTISSIISSPLAIPANSFAPVIVLVNVAGAGTTGAVTITATSQTIPTITSSSLANVSVPSGQTIPINPGVPVGVPSTSLPISTNGHIVFIPLCPSTPEGVASLLTTMAGLTSGEAVAFSWDASTQAYVKLPSQPAGGLQPTNGVFIATSVGLNIDFSGTSELAPAPIPLQPGWNLFGVPPVDFGNGTQTTTHPFPSGFALIDPVSGLPVSSLAEFVSILGTGTTDVTTTEPYLFDGTSYTQVSTLQSGTAYWIKNNASVPVNLIRVATGPVLSALHRGTVYGSASATSSQPPAAPASTLNADSSSGHCGVSAGASVLMGLAVLLWRRRP